MATPAVKKEEIEKHETIQVANDSEANLANVNNNNNNNVVLKPPALLAVKLEEMAILSATSDSELDEPLQQQQQQQQENDSNSGHNRQQYANFRDETTRKSAATVAKNKQKRKKQAAGKSMKIDPENRAGADEEEDDEEEPPYEPPSPDVQQRLLDQLEFYFSDENILKDTFLLKHIQKDKQGFVSLKLLASFRKMQRVTKNWRDLVYALEHKGSEKLAINEKRNKVKRTQPLPEWDKTVHDRTVVVFNYESIVGPDQSPIDAITSHFSSSPVNTNHNKNEPIKTGLSNDENCPKNDDIIDENSKRIPQKSPETDADPDCRKYSDGCEISLVRLIQPGKKVPKDLQGFLNKNHPEMVNKPCALVEFRTLAMTRQILKKFSGRDDWRGMQVLPLKKETLKKPIITKTSSSSAAAADSQLAKSPGKSTTNKGAAINLHRAVQERCSSLNAQSHGGGYESGGGLSDGGGGGGGGLSSSPRYHGNHDRRKLCHTSSDANVVSRRSPLLTLNSPSATTHKNIGRVRSHVSPECWRKQNAAAAAEDSPLSCSPGSLGSGGSPWIRRRMLQGADSIGGSTELCKNLICIIRQPQGPDGTKGFLTKRK